METLKIVIPVGEMITLFDSSFRSVGSLAFVGEPKFGFFRSFSLPCNKSEETLCKEIIRHRNLSIILNTGCNGRFQTCHKQLVADGSGTEPL